MSNPKGNPNLKGKKGRSGRKSARVEGAKNLTIQRAWEKLREEIDSKDVTQIALPVALKDMAQKTDLTTLGEKITGINYIIPDGNKPTTNP